MKANFSGTTNYAIVLRALQIHAPKDWPCQKKEPKSLPSDTISGPKMYQKCFCSRSSALHLLGELTARLVSQRLNDFSATL